MPPRHYRYLTKYYDQPPRGFLLFNAGSKFQKTGSSGFKTIKSPATEAAADLKTSHGQWLGNNQCLTWDEIYVYNKGKGYKICNPANANIVCCFVKGSYLVALCNIGVNNVVGVRVFLLSSLIDFNVAPGNTLNTPAAEFLDPFNTFKQNGNFKDCTVNKPANKLVLIGTDATTTAYPGAAIVYSIGDVSLDNDDWFTFSSRFTNSESEFRHFCIWNNSNLPEYAIRSRETLYPPYYGVSHFDIYYKFTTSYRGGSFESGTTAFVAVPPDSYYVSETKDCLAIGVNRYVDDYVFLSRKTTYSGSSIVSGYVWTAPSKQSVFSIGLPSGAAGLNSDDLIEQSDFWLLNWPDVFGNMLYTYKTPSFYLATNWPNESDVKIFKSGFVAESIEKQTAIEAIVSTPANVKGVI